MPDRRRCAVLGSPVAHSLSPRLWRAAYAELGLDWTYDAIECTSDDLPERLAGMAASGEWVAVSLTMPLKLTAVSLVDDLDAAAAAAGAVNTVVFEPDRLRGMNTDVPGLSACLDEAGAVVADRAAPLVLGGGGTARAAVVALARAGAETVRVAVRDTARATPLLAVGARSGCEVRLEAWPMATSELGEPPVVVQTAPAGAADGLAATGEWPPGVPLVEVLYDPRPTDLAVAAGRSGARVVDGLRLLAHQAAVAIAVVTRSSIQMDVLGAALR